MTRRVVLAYQYHEGFLLRHQRFDFEIADSIPVAYAQFVRACNARRLKAPLILFYAEIIGDEEMYETHKKSN